MSIWKGPLRNLAIVQVAADRLPSIARASVAEEAPEYFCRDLVHLQAHEKTIPAMSNFEIKDFYISLYRAFQIN